MHRKLITTAVAGLLALAIAQPAQAGQIISATPGGHDAEVAFNSGVTYNAGVASYQKEFDDPTIWNQLAGLIDRAKPGSTIRMSLYVADGSSEVVSSALERTKAPGRDVNVWLVDDSFHQIYHDAADLYKACGGPCLSNNSSAIQHTKFATFSATKQRDGTDATNVTWISSANLDTRTGNSEFNNALVYYDSPQMYQALVKVWNDMWNGPVVRQSSAGASDADYLDPNTGRGFWNATEVGVTGWVSPEQDGPSLWYSVLNPIKTKDPAGQPAGCTVRVMHANWADELLRSDRMDPAHKLVDLKNAGCDVKIVTHRMDDSESADGKVWYGDPKIAQSTLDLLCNANIPVHSLMRVHDKFVISSSYYGLSPTTEVMTGSHNLTVAADRRNDELLIRQGGALNIYNAFLTHWNEAFNNGIDACMQRFTVTDLNG